MLFYAAKKFKKQNFYFHNQWAPKSALMAAYAYYSQDYYDEQLLNLDRFLKIYPKHKNIDYAYYLLAISIMSKL